MQECATHVNKYASMGSYCDFINQLFGKMNGKTILGRVGFGIECF